MAKRYINVPVSLVDLGSDSEGDSPVSQPPPVPAASSGHSSTHTPRRHPTVSDDDSYEYTPRGPPPRQAAAAPRPPAACPQPPPMTYPPPMPDVHPHAPRPHYHPRMSVRPMPPHPLAPVDGYPMPYPHTRYEHGESSRRAAHDRRVDSLAAHVRETRATLSDLMGNQGRLVDRVGEIAEDFTLWRQTFEQEAQVAIAGFRRGHDSLARRTTWLERWVTAAFVAAFVALLVGAMLRYYQR